MSATNALPDCLMPSPVATAWYALQTKYRFEKKVAAQLTGKNIETFVPLREELHRWSDRQKLVPVPLFSGYVLVHLHLSPALRLSALQTEGTIGFVTFQGRAMPIPGKQIEDLRRLLSQKVACSLHAFLKVGRHVRIRGGCLDGLEGILEESGHKTLVISIDGIQRSVAVKIEGYELELA